MCVCVPWNLFRFHQKTQQTFCLKSRDAMGISLGGARIFPRFFGWFPRSSLPPSRDEFGSEGSSLGQASDSFWLEHDSETCFFGAELRFLLLFCGPRFFSFLDSLAETDFGFCIVSFSLFISLVPSRSKSARACLISAVYCGSESFFRWSTSDCRVLAGWNDFVENH